LSRRTVLRGAGVSVALPWLEAMSGVDRKAHAAAPKRFLVFFSPNGHIRDAWMPTGTPDNFQLSRTLAPLEKLKNDIVILDGVDNVAAANSKGPGDDHQRGMGTMLTAIEVLPGKSMGGCVTCAPAGLAGGPSVDQEIVARTKPPTKFPSLELGVRSGQQGTVWGYSSYKAAGQPLPLDNSPLSVWKRVFTDLQVAGGDNTFALKLQMERRSVLDAVQKNYQFLLPRLGTEDRKKLDQHLTSIRELEGRILAAGGPSAAAKGCANPAAPATIDFGANDNFPKVATMQMDLMVMAMACDLARVGTIQFEHSTGETNFTWLGATRGHHTLSHDPDSNADTKELLTKIDVWFAQQLTYLMTRMKDFQEEGGTMLDNSLILWCNELSKGNSHSHPDMPFVLAGHAGGKIKGGRWLKFAGTVSHSNLLVSVLNAMDVPATTFGNPAYCTGPLAGL
jgi:hypothetical protein